MLKRKQNVSNDEWLNAVANIESTVSKNEIIELAEKTVAEIKGKTADKKCAYAWSAGKDSIVLSDICDKAGVTDSMIAVCNLEYPAFLKWIKDNKPSGCTVCHKDMIPIFLPARCVMPTAGSFLPK